MSRPKCAICGANEGSISNAPEYGEWTCALCYWFLVHNFWHSLRNVWVYTVNYFYFKKIWYLSKWFYCCMIRNNRKLFKARMLEYWTNKRGIK